MEPRSLRFERYTPRDRPQVLELVRASRSPAYSDRLSRHWGWKYDANPFNGDGGPYILLLKDGDRVVGMNGAFPLRVSIRGHEHAVKCGGDLAIHPEYRRRGLSRVLLDRFVVDNPVTISWQSDISRRATSHLSETYYSRVDFLVRPLDVVQIVRSLLGRGSSGQVVAAGQQRLTRSIPRRSLSGITVDEVAAFDERADDLWRRVRGELPVMWVRDRATLNWRFVARPDARYTLIAATRGSQLVGYAVLRLIEQQGLRCGYLVDVLADRSARAALPTLLSEASRRLRSQGAAVIACIASAGPYRHALYRRGFVPLRWGPPNYFCSRAAVQDPTLHLMDDVRHWFLTMADGDLELAY